MRGSSTARGPVTCYHSIDLGDSAGDVRIGTIPWTGARVKTWGMNIVTAGTGTSANHTPTLEAGSTTNGVAIASQLTLDADGTAGTTYVTGSGHPIPSAAAKAQLIAGNALQLQSAQSAAITDGAIVDIFVEWY